MYMRLYWVETEDHCEDWFIVARNHEEAQTFHEQNEGYLPGDAAAEEILAIPDEVVSQSRLAIRGGPAGSPAPNSSIEGDARVVQINGRRFCEGLLEQTLRSLDDDRFEANGQGRLNGTQKTSRELN